MVSLTPNFGLYSCCEKAACIFQCHVCLTFKFWRLLLANNQCRYLPSLAFDADFGVEPYQLLLVSQLKLWLTAQAQLRHEHLPGFGLPELHCWFET